MKANYNKFDGMDYTNTFARKISVMHELVKSVLATLLNNGDLIIDIGGGPGIGAKLIDQLGLDVKVLNIEPSDTIDDIPKLYLVKYLPFKMTIKDALDTSLPWKGDCILMMSAEHEIALSNGKSPLENKQIFFQDLKKFINNNAKENGNIIIRFPNYREHASEDEISRQRKFTESLLGHSHPKEEFFLLEEFILSFGINPTHFEHKPMTLADEGPENTLLVANVAVFKIKDLLNKSI